MDCAKCKSSNKVKRRIIKGRQRYTCKDCGYNYKVVKKSTAKSDIIKRQALQLYLERPGFRSIGRFLNVSHIFIYQWIKAFGSNLETTKSNDEMKVVEPDEMHSYIGNKNYFRIWIAVDRYGKRFIHFLIGDRGAVRERYQRQNY